MHFSTTEFFLLLFHLSILHVWVNHTCGKVKLIFRVIECDENGYRVSNKLVDFGLESKFNM